MHRVKKTANHVIALYMKTKREHVYNGIPGMKRRLKSFWQNIQDYFISVVVLKKLERKRKQAADKCVVLDVGDFQAVEKLLMISRKRLSC